MTLSELAASLKNGEVGVFPTDTLYGILGSALLPGTVSRIYKIKKRNISKPFIVLIEKFEDINKFGARVSEGDLEKLKKVWPGPVSVILPCANEKFEYLHRGTGKIAFRLPAKSDLIDLLKQTGPLVAPSANREGDKPAENIKRAKEYFGDSVDFYEDGGPLSGPPSTLLELTDSGLKVVREGATKLNLNEEF